MTCAFAVISGVDQALLRYLGVEAEEAPLLSPMAVPLDIVVEDSGCTLEVKQVLADQYAALILVEFTAPEGTVLNGEQYESALSGPTALPRRGRLPHQMAKELREEVFSGKH